MDGPTVIYVIIAAVIAAIGSAVLVKLIDRLRRKDAETEAREILARADRESANRRKEAELEIKEMAIQQKAEGEKELGKLRQELHERERLLDKRQDALEQQADQLRKQEKMVENNQRKLAERIEDTNRRNEELAKLLDLQRQTLHQLSGLSREEATQRLLEMLDQELQHEQGALIIKHEKQDGRDRRGQSRAKSCSPRIQRYAAAHTAETTTSTVDIPSDEMKGRIIGREGRNIRAFEKATGVDVIIDDTPGVVIVSGFDPVRREIARHVAQQADRRRPHPSRADRRSWSPKRRRKWSRTSRSYGEEAAQEADVRGLHPKVIHLLGRLHFRTSYSQNVLRHSIEVAFLAGMMAEEMGHGRRPGPPLRPAARHRQGGRPRDRRRPPEDRRRPAQALRRRAGSRPRGPRPPRRYPHRHPVHGACRRGRRLQRLAPGARRETLERYIKRMEELETIATGFPGVEQAFAIQAGRELRVIASAKDTTDASAAKICRDIAKAFEAAADLSRRDQSHDAPRNARHRNGKIAEAVVVTVSKRRLSDTSCRADPLHRRHRRQTRAADRRAGRCAG